MKITKVNTIEEATHWIPRYDENIYSQVEDIDVSLNNPYKIYKNPYKEYIIFDDIGMESSIWENHNGEFVILKM